jgi:hypothetical protein
MSGTRSTVKLLTALATGLVLAMSAACGGDGGGGGGGNPDRGDMSAAPGEVFGVITNVKRSGAKIEGFTLKPTDGEAQEITLDPTIDYGFDPELLEQYRQAGNDVRVTVEPREGKLYATVILNA